MGIIGEWGVLNTWFLSNMESIPPSMVQGNYPTEITQTLGNKFTTHQSLSRQHPIIHFLSGELETISFEAILYARDAADPRLKMALKNLKTWRKIDGTTKRPPVLKFWIGDSHLSLSKCMIKSLGPITWHHPTEFGQVRHVTLSINLIRYQPFSLEPSPPTETRYHRARNRDYYEMLCQYEYGNPYLGDVIRKRHPQKLKLVLADIVKLPSIGAIRKDVIEPKSLILATAFGNRATPQRSARLAMLDKRNRTHVSHVLGDNQ